jgi:ribonuclease HI
MLPKIDSYFTRSENKSDKKDPRKIFPEFDYKMNFDGCSKGNPGLAGAGAVIYKFNDECWSESFYIGEEYTNNYAEYTGLVLGLKQAIKLGIKNLLVEGDSLLVINHMKGIYKCKSENLVELYQQAKKLESNFGKIQYVHVLRHKNKRADELSNIAIDNYLTDNASDD